MLTVSFHYEQIGITWQRFRAVFGILMFFQDLPSHLNTLAAEENNTGFAVSYNNVWR